MIAFNSLAADDFQSGLDAYQKGNYAIALKVWLPLAESGSAMAQLYVGNIFGDGKGVEVDHTKALQWFRKAAEQGNPEAQFNVGLFYYFGLGGLTKDLDKAADWYRKSAAQGYEKAIKNLKLIALQKQVEAQEEELNREDKRSSIGNEPTGCKIVNWRSRHDVAGNIWIEGATSCISGQLTIRAYEAGTKRYLGNAHTRIEAYAFEALIQGASATSLSIRYVIQ